MVEVIGGSALLVLGFIVGGTAAFYKGWDEGFREGYNKEIAENASRLMSVTARSSQEREAVRSSGRNDYTTRKAS